jgi:DNA-binding MarR family transcriptional regulator
LAWDILLELTASKLEGVPVPTSSLCIAAAVPTMTALRWINRMVEQGLLTHRSDPTDRRRVFVELTPQGWVLVNAYLSDIVAGRAEGERG